MGFWPYGFQNFVSLKGFLAKPDDFANVKLRIRPSKIVEAQMQGWVEERNLTNSG